MTVPPTITTERLTLRPMTIDDWSDYVSLMQSDRAVFMGGPLSTFDAWGMFCHDIAQWNLFGHGALMFEEKRSGECLGQVGINHGPLFPEHELGWYLYRQAEGNGYAFEAAKTFRDWVRSERKLPTLVSYIAPANHRSKKLAERLGASLDETAKRPDPVDLVFRHY